MKPRFSKTIIYAAAMDAYAKAKRKGLPPDECNDAEFERLFQAIGGPTGWMELPAGRTTERANKRTDCNGAGLDYLGQGCGHGRNPPEHRHDI
jgi:hypothetical protein